MVRKSTKRVVAAKKRAVKKKATKAVRDKRINAGTRYRVVNAPKHTW